MRFVDVSHPVIDGMKTYPGLPAPRLEVVLDYKQSREKYQGKAEFYMASLHLCGNTGTYVDAPLHRFRRGRDLAMLPLESLAHLPVTVIDARDRTGRGIGPDRFEGRELRGRAVLVNTGWSVHWRKEQYFEANPFLTGEACDALLQAGAAFVGIDSVNIDDMDDLARPAHTKLLRAGVPICEHMTRLEFLRPDGGWLHAVPIPWIGGASFPVRAYVLYD
jgi:kynurenine formamidase